MHLWNVACGPRPAPVGCLHVCAEWRVVFFGITVWWIMHIQGLDYSILFHVMTYCPSCRCHADAFWIFIEVLKIFKAPRATERSSGNAASRSEAEDGDSREQTRAWVPKSQGWWAELDFAACSAVFAISFCVGLALPWGLLWANELVPTATACHSCWHARIPRDKPSPRWERSFLNGKLDHV
jgi:hypothetical protein